MGGTISLTSTFGKGSTMTVRVPFKKAPFVNGADISTASAPALSLAGRDGRPNREDVRILLAEGESTPSEGRKEMGADLFSLRTDNELIREIVTKLIRNMKVSFACLAEPNGRTKLTSSPLAVPSRRRQGWSSCRCRRYFETIRYHVRCLFNSFAHQ
jgi:hypothetical protein